MDDQFRERIRQAAALAQALPVPEIKGDELAGRVAIVTGSSRGLGRALAIGFAKAGANVVVTGRTERPEQSRIPGTIHETVEAINALGQGRAIAVRCDLKEAEQVKALVDRSVEAFGQIDILVNNAGDWTSPGPTILDIPVNHWDHIMSLDVRATFLTCKYVLPHMIARKQGSIINVSSGAADINFPPLTTYCVAKAAQERFSGCLAEDVKQHNIAVNVLRPGSMQTEGVWDHGYPLDPELIKLYPSPEVVLPSALWLAQLTDSAFTGRVLNYLEFGKGWP